MQVIYASDDAYAQHMGISILTLLRSNVDMEYITINIIDGGISEDNKAEIKRIIHSFSREYHFVKTTDIQQDYYPLWNDPSPLTFARLYATEYFPNYDKALYLDCDTVINGSLKEIWDIDLKDYLLAGVQDVVEPYFLRYSGMKYSERYVNAGVLLLNLAKWKEIDFILEVNKYIEGHIYKGNEKDLSASERNRLPLVKMNSGENNAKKLEESYALLPLLDQGIINGICKHSTYILPLKYNTTNYVFFWKRADIIKKIRQIKNYYSQSEIDAALINPIIVHYIVGIYGRPWHSTCSHPCKHLYTDALAMTAWKDTLQVCPTTKSDRLRVWLFNNIPITLYMLYERILRIRRKYMQKFSLNALNRGEQNL